MALPTVGDVAKVVVRGHIGNHPMQNVFHTRIDSPLDLVQAQAIGDQIGAAYDELLAEINTGNGWDNVEVYDLATAGGPQFTILPATWPLIGAQTDGSMPPAVAAVVSWRGASGGRAGRGRTYLGGFDEDGSEGDAIESATIAKLEAFRDAMLAIDGNLVIVSYYLGTDKTQVNRKNVPIPRVTPVVTDVVTGIVRPYWGSQRRRADLT